MRKILLGSVTLIAASLFSMSAYADNLKIGVIDVEQIMQKAPQIAEVNSQLTKQFKPRQEQLVAAQKSLQDETDKFNRNGSVMSAGDRNKLQDQINSDKGDLQTKSVAFQRDLNLAQQQAMQSFMGTLTGVVAQVAKQDKFDLVLQKAGVPYASSNLDITSEVIDALKKKD